MGRVEVLNDDKEVIGYQYQTADADIFVQTVCPYEEKMERAYEKKIYTEKERRKYYLKWNDIKVSIWDDKNQYQHAERLTRVSVDIRRTFCTSGFSWNGEGTGVSSAEETIYGKEEVQTMLSENFHRFCVELEKRGFKFLKIMLKYT